MAIENLAFLDNLEQNLLGYLTQELEPHQCVVRLEPVGERPTAPVADRQVDLSWVGDNPGNLNSFNRGQEISRQFRILIQCKGVNTHRELYLLVDEILLALRSWSPENADAPVVSRCRPFGYDDAGFYQAEIFVLIPTHLLGG